MALAASTWAPTAEERRAALAWGRFEERKKRDDDDDDDDDDDEDEREGEREKRLEEVEGGRGAGKRRNFGWASNRFFFCSSFTFRFASYSASSCGSLRRCSGCWSSLLTSANAAARAVEASSGTPTAAGGGDDDDGCMAFLFCVWKGESGGARERSGGFFRLSFHSLIPRPPSVTIQKLFIYSKNKTNRNAGASSHIARRFLCSSL